MVHSIQQMLIPQVSPHRSPLSYTGHVPSLKARLQFCKQRI